MKETKDFGIDINFYQYSESFLNDVFISNDLSILFNLSENNMKKLNVILGMNLNFSELQKLPNISIWNMNNVEDISFMFYGCSLLTFLRVKKIIFLEGNK